VKALSDGRGVDIVYDPIGAGVTEESLRTLAWGGRLLVLGFLGGGPANIRSNYLLIKGIDVVGTLTPFKGFNIRVVGDYEDGKFQDYIGCLKYIDINGNPQCAQINGSPLERQPKFQVRVTPSYTVVPGPWGDVTGWVTYEHVGQRYEDLTGLQPLGTYYMLSAGIVANVGNNWQFRVQGTNLTNQIGLTEGNARVTGGESGVGGVLLARPYEGREVNVTAKYKF